MPNDMVQVKFTIESGIVSAFKSKCAAEGVSMASEIKKFMTGCQPAGGVKIKTDSRPLRKKSLQAIISLVDEIMYKEEQYRDAIPENFAQRFETADETCQQLAEAIALLEEAYL